MLAIVQRTRAHAERMSRLRKIVPDTQACFKAPQVALPQQVEEFDSFPSSLWTVGV